MFQRFLPFLAVKETQQKTCYQKNDADMHARHAKDVHGTSCHIVFANFISKLVVITQQDGSGNPKLIIVEATTLQRSQQDVTKTILGMPL